jgi:hypothetical protein
MIGQPQSCHKNQIAGIATWTTDRVELYLAG